MPIGRAPAGGAAAVQLATPYSVTTVCTWARVVTTPAPGSQRAARSARRVPSLAVEGSAMIGLPLLGQRRAADEVHLAADAAVEPAADRVGADLAGEIDLDARS